MTLALGTRLGPYEVTAQIGAGGMGEVYRARDTRLTRDVTPPSIRSTSFARAPDGQRLVFTAEAEQTTQLWLRTLDSEMARPLKGTESGGAPFWSPGGPSIGFFADQKLKRLDTVVLNWKPPAR